MHATDEPPSILSSTPGRIRLGLAGLDVPSLEALRTRLVRLRGVTRVETNDLTKNVLVHYNPSAISLDAVVDAVRTIHRDLIPESTPAYPRPASMQRSKRQAARPLLAGSASLLSVALAVVAAESPLHLALAAVDAIKLVASLSEG